MDIATALLGGGALSFLGQIFGSQAAAGAQTAAASKAIDAELAMFGITRAGLQPFINEGTGPGITAMQGTPARAAVGETWRNPTTGQTVTRPFGAADVARPGATETWRNPKTGQTVTRPFGFTPPNMKGNLLSRGFKEVSAGRAAVPTLAARGFRETSAGRAARPAVPGALQGAETPVPTLAGQPGYDFATGAATPGSDMLTQLEKPITMDQATLAQTPGYQWALAQGEKGVTNALSARGLAGGSGAEIKGAEQYATGLASQTYQQQYANALANKQQAASTFGQNFANQFSNKQLAYNAAMGVAGLGEGAAAGVGTAATATGGQLANAYVGAGQAQAGADIAGANALTGFTNNFIYATPQGSNYLNTLMKGTTTQ